MEPHIELLPVQEIPRSVPEHITGSFYKAPDTFEQREMAQVIFWGDHVYWVFDFTHSGPAAIIAYNNRMEMVKRWNLRDVRYIWDIKIDLFKKTVTLWGQDNRSETFKLQDLCLSKMQDASINPPPVVKILPSAQVPGQPRPGCTRIGLGRL